MSPDLEIFLDTARSARRETDWPQRVAEAMRDLIRSAGPNLTGGLRADLAASPTKGIAVYVQSTDLTIYAVEGAGGLRSAPHDHATTAVVGLIEGSEGHRTWIRQGDRLTEGRSVRVEAGQVAIMGEETVHSMWCDPNEAGLSLHVYGNSHFDAPGRHQWDPETLVEEPFDVTRQRAWIAELTRAARVRGSDPGLARTLEGRLEDRLAPKFVIVGRQD